MLTVGAARQGPQADGLPEPIHLLQHRGLHGHRQGHQRRGCDTSTTEPQQATPRGAPIQLSDSSTGPGVARVLSLTPRLACCRPWQRPYHVRFQLHEGLGPGPSQLILEHSLSCVRVESCARPPTSTVGVRRTHARAHARTHARTHAHNMHARAHARSRSMCTRARFLNTFFLVAKATGVGTPLFDKLLKAAMDTEL